MDLFRFTNPTSKSRMESGQLINNTISKTWVERYREAGEVSIVGRDQDGLRQRLPIGSFVGHADSQDIMIIESHELTETANSEITVTVSGRSLETFLDHRIVGSNKNLSSVGTVTDYELPAWSTWDQAHYLISRHILPEYLVDDDNALLYFEVRRNGKADPQPFEERLIRSDSVYSAVLSILEVDDYGIKVIRPGPWSPGVNNENTVILIHPGIDRTNVVFSYESGEIASADYLWSNKKSKNCAYVTSKWFDLLIDSSAKGFDRRMMHVDASDIDRDHSEIPTGLSKTLITTAMRALGRERLAAQKNIALTDVTVGRASAVYRKHYNVGDLVNVAGRYNETAKMRVVEYAEIEDENGFYGAPTLEIPPVPGED